MCVIVNAKSGHHVTKQNGYLPIRKIYIDDTMSYCAFPMKKMFWCLVPRDTRPRDYINERDLLNFQDDAPRPRPQTPAADGRWRALPRDGHDNRFGRALFGNIAG